LHSAASLKFGKLPHCLESHFKTFTKSNFQVQPGPSRRRASEGQCIFSDGDFGNLKKRKLLLEIEALETDKATKREKRDLELKNLEVQIKVGEARAQFFEMATNILAQNPEYLCQMFRMEP